MPRGRPPKPGTAEEKAAARREKVRLNVKALRERRKRAASAQQSERNHPKVVWVRENSQSASSTGRISEVDNEDTSSPRSLQSGSSSQTSLISLSRKDEFPCPLPQSIDAANQYALALLGMFRTQFLPEAIHLPSIHRRPSAKILPNDDFVWTPCAFWVTNAFSKASYHNHTNLRSTLLAIGLALNGVRHQDEAMKAASLEMYRKGLRGLRGSLDQVAKPSSTLNIDRAALFLTCHAAAMFELIQNSNLGATMQHIVGLGQLMLHLGEGEEESRGTVPGLLLQDYRTLEMPFCLKYRYEPKLSHKRRQSRSLPTTLSSDFGLETLKSLHNSNMMTAITDTADDICLIMVRLDQLKTQIPNRQIYAEVEVLLERLTLILTAFDLWTSQLQARYGPIEIKNSEAYQMTEPLQFTSFELASAYMFSLVNRAYGIETCIEAVGYLGSWELSLCQIVDSMSFRTEPGSEKPARVAPLQKSKNLAQRLQHFRGKLRSTAVLLTRSIFYFFDVDKGIIGQTIGLFALETAKEMLNNEMRRLQEDMQHMNLQTLQSLTQADTTAKTKIKSLVGDIEGCLDYCKEMQVRAQMFGLPSVFDT